MATTIEVEVMYGETDPDIGGLLRKRVGLDRVHTLPRENVLYIILSDIVPSIHPHTPRRILGGNAVERLAVVSWDDTETVAFIVRRAGEVCLQFWEEDAWNWIQEIDPFRGSTGISGAAPTFPADALLFHMYRKPFAALTARATSDYGADMF